MTAATVEEAFAYCEARAKAHYENFPVGLFVPREKRPYVSRALHLRPGGGRLRGRADLRGGAPGEARPVGGAHRGRVPRRGRGADLRRPRRDGAPARHPEGAAPRPALRLPAGHREVPLRELGRAPRLLPALGEPRGAPGAARLRPEGPRAARALRRDLHGPPARQPLAGRGHRLRPGPDLRARGPHAAPRGRHLGLQHRPGERRLARDDGRADRPDAWPLRGGPAAVRPGGPRAAVRDAAHVARRDLDPRPHRGDRGRRVPARPKHGPLDKAALAWRAWRWPSA